MAELVDALVSNTNEVTLVPVRLRLWVQQVKIPPKLEGIFFYPLPRRISIGAWLMIFRPLSHPSMIVSPVIAA